MSADTLPMTEAVADKYACSLSGLTATHPDGRTAALDKCDWVQVAPCGCSSGVIVSMIGDKVLLTADMALREMAHNAADAREDVKLGYRMVLILHADFAEAFPRGTCEHDPQWGHVRERREVDGITWTRLGSTEWTASDGWRMEKWAGGWHLYPPPKSTSNRIPWLGTKLDEALTKASAYITGATT